MRSASKPILALLAAMILAAGTFALLAWLSSASEAPEPAADRAAPPAGAEEHPGDRPAVSPGPSQPLAQGEDDWLNLTPGKARKRRGPGLAKLRRGGRPAQQERLPDLVEPPAEPEPEAPPDTTPPLLRILSPKGPTVIMTPKLLLRVRSEAGVQVTVDALALAENSPGLFARDLQLAPGRNDLAVVAMDAAGNRAEEAIRVTYVSDEQIREKKGRFTSLMEQLDEIQAAAADLDQRTEMLVRQLRKEGDAVRVARLSAELRTIRNTRRELRQEIERAISEVDKMLKRTR